MGVMGPAIEAIKMNKGGEGEESAARVREMSKFVAKEAFETFFKDWKDKDWEDFDKKWKAFYR